MKKTITVLTILCLCLSVAFGFTACKFNVPSSSGKEIINEQPEDKEENGENNNEEETAITKDTDFDALKSDIVDKDVFVSALVFFMSSSDPYTTINVNVSRYLEEQDGDSYTDGTFKFDRLKRHIEQNVKYKDNDGLDIAYQGEAYIVMAKDLKSYVQFAAQSDGVHRETQISKGDPGSHSDTEEFNGLVNKLWDNAVYNERTHQYEISQFKYNNYFINSSKIKIKGGYVVFIEATGIGEDGNAKMSRAKCYDFGTTVVDIPDEVMRAINAKR